MKLLNVLLGILMVIFLPIWGTAYLVFNGLSLLLDCLNEIGKPVMEWLIFDAEDFFKEKLNFMKITNKEIK